MKNCKILNNLGCKDMHDVWINGYLRMVIIVQLNKRIFYKQMSFSNFYRFVLSIFYHRVSCCSTNSSGNDGNAIICTNFSKTNGAQNGHNDNNKGKKSGIATMEIKSHCGNASRGG
ncbi:uncharacterized protein LOC107965756 isoform X1 [Apis mellifera]|uniref:Uncharacterized protein LOC107965756 isoform X1 n=1 Tax=Apis mellifera TaxID=7460 RepID=A0A7M7MV66_APIME|nr:uncharacterized protein LOC107965756 isoform X1 [Apis mellifera]|eukprot:XP_026301528.1 uncharacterized protein LOC107965756 isoform X1 [Apis mellifera]